MLTCAKCFLIILIIFYISPTSANNHDGSSQNAMKKSMTLPIYSNYFELYMYFIYVQVGTPGVNISVVVDTGSSDFLVPGSSCIDCVGGLPKNKYNPSHSSTYTPIACGDPDYSCSYCTKESLCGFTMPYVGITENATAVIDVVNNSEASVEFPFGMITSITFGTAPTTQSAMEYYRYPEGMFGLAYASLNTLGTETYFDALVNAKLVKNVFSICLNLNGGYLTLGESRLNKHDYEYTPILREDYYRINITDILIGGESLGYNATYYNSKHCIVDTGTTVPTLTYDTYNRLQRILLANCTNNPLSGLCVNLGANGTTIFDNVCFELNSREIAMWPDLTFVLEGNVRLVYTSEYYLMKMYYCRSGTVGMGIGMEVDWAIIGARLLQVYETFFDRENQQIGFAPTQTC